MHFVGVIVLMCKYRGFRGFREVMCVFAVSQCLLVGVLNANMDLTKLTRKQCIKIVPAFACSVDDCSLAMGQVVVTAALNPLHILTMRWLTL